MGRISVDVATVTSHVSRITSSHQEIPGVASRSETHGNTSGTASSEYFTKLQEAVDQLSTHVGLLQEQVAQTAGAMSTAASSQAEHDQLVKAKISKISAVMDLPTADTTVKVPVTDAPAPSADSPASPATESAEPRTAIN